MEHREAATTTPATVLLAQEVPETLCAMTALQELWLYSNHLTRMPDAMGQLQRLRRLWLDRNALTTLPLSLTQLTALQVWWLYGGRHSLHSTSTRSCMWMATRCRTFRMQCWPCRASRGGVRGTMHSCSSVPSMEAEADVMITTTVLPTAISMEALYLV